MKKLVTVILLVFVGLATAYGQPGKGMARIHAAKMAYVTDRLHLNSSQSVGFVPLYNEYEKEVRDTRQSYFRKYKGANPDQTDDATSRQFIDDNLDYQQAVIGIKRKYNELFLKIISPQQLADLYKAEREFNQLLMQRLRQKGNNGGRFNRRGAGNGY